MTYSSQFFLSINVRFKAPQLNRRAGAKQKGAVYGLKAGGSSSAKATVDQGLAAANYKHLETFGGSTIFGGGWQLAVIRHCVLPPALSDATETLRGRRKTTPASQL